MIGTLIGWFVVAVFAARVGYLWGARRFSARVRRVLRQVSA